MTRPSEDEATWFIDASGIVCICAKPKLGVRDIPVAIVSQGVVDGS